MRCLAVAATFAVAPHATAGGEADTELPLPPIKWRDYTASPDTRILYVSSSEGDDATAKASDRTRPFRTIHEALRFVQNGYADWLVLRCGDVFDAGFDGADRWTTSGRSAAEPVLVASYGEGPRPRISGLRTNNGGNGAKNFINHAAFYGIHFTEDIEIRTGGEGITFEDCYFERCQVSIQGFGPVEGRPHLRDVTLRRCIFDNNWEVDGRPQNLYVTFVDGLLIEGCFFWRGGWNPDVQGAEATILNHNVYIQYHTSDVEFRGNITVDAASHGAQLRSGGICEGNLFLKNPIGLQLGSTQNKTYPNPSATGEARYNVILDGRDIDAQPRGHAIWIDHAGPLHVHHNIIAHQRSGSSGVAITAGAAYHDLRISDNIIYDWTAGADPRQTRGFILSGDARGHNVIEDNIVELVHGGQLIDDRTTVPGAWHFGDVRESVAFRDPQRDIESYMRSLGMEGGLDRFVQECLSQRKRTWRDAFTAYAVVEYIFEGFEIVE